MSQPEVLDRGVIDSLRLFEEPGEDLVSEMVSLFLQDSRIVVSRILAGTESASPEQLERDRAVHVDLGRQIHDPHTAFSKLPLDTVALLEDGAGRQSIR